MSRRWRPRLLPLLLGVAVATFGLIGFTAGTAVAAKQISAKALDDHTCDSTEWHFIINQIDQESNAPASIHVTWANGAEADLPLDKFTPGGVAHYVTTANLDSTVTSATATIYDSWGGQFNLSHGPCGPPPTPPGPPGPPNGEGGAGAGAGAGAEQAGAPAAPAAGAVTARPRLTG